MRQCAWMCTLYVYVYREQSERGTYVRGSVYVSVHPVLVLVQCGRATRTHQPYIHSHSSLLTRLASKCARAHVTPNLAPILAGMYGAVAGASGSSSPMASFRFANSPLYHAIGTSIHGPGKEHTQVTPYYNPLDAYCKTTILPDLRLYIGVTVKQRRS